MVRGEEQHRCGAGDRAVVLPEARTNMRRADGAGIFEVIAQRGVDAMQQRRIAREIDRNGRGLRQARDVLIGQHRVIKPARAHECDVAR